MSKRVLFLISDTGGGHRSAVEAIVEAMNLDYPGAFDCEVIDFLRQYYPFPLRYAPEIYPRLEKIGAWGLSYKLMDGRGRTNVAVTLSYPVIRKGIKRLLREHPADLIVSVHPLVNSTLPKAMRRNPSPFVTVVTDMVSTHAFWYDRRANLIVVPTEQAKQRGVHYGIPAGNVRVIGVPIAERFLRQNVDAVQWRADAGWAADRPVVLLVGGGDGMGPVKRVAKAINEAQLPISLAVICGRNAKLKAELEALEWNIPAHIYGFTSQMPQFMSAADILITKAGPGTISEGFVSSLPMILYAKVTGQEDGNVDYVVSNGAGVWAPHRADVVAALAQWVEHPDQMEQASQAAASLARPQASHDIARLIAGEVGLA